MPRTAAAAQVGVLRQNCASAAGLLPGTSAPRRLPTAPPALLRGSDVCSLPAFPLLNTAALHLACRHAQLACVRALLEAGATQLPDSHGRTPVQVAEAAGHADVMALIQHHNEVQQQLQEQELQAAAGEAAAAAAAAGDEPGQGQQSGELGRQ
jgi:ankyrin repeat protein